MGKRIQIAASLHVKNIQGQSNPPVKEIVSQLANYGCVFTVKYILTSIQGPFGLSETRLARLYCNTIIFEVIY